MAAIRAAANTTASIVPRSQIAGRAVHIKIHPRPRNISESRQVLRVLEHYGEIVMYKHLKVRPAIKWLIGETAIGGIQHEPQAPAPNTAMAIYQYEKAAIDLLDASPIRFVLEVDTRGGTSAPAHSVKTSQLAPDVPKKGVNKEGIGAGLEGLEKRGGIPETGESTGSSEWGFMARYRQRSADSRREEAKDSEAHSQASPSTEPEVAPPPSSNAKSHPHHELQHREFQLTISRSHLNHQAYIERQAYYGSFEPDMRSIMAEDLESRVPLKGLADCKLGKEEVPLRIRQKRKEKVAERGWVGLKGLWEIGRREEQRLETPVE